MSDEMVSFGNTTKGGHRPTSEVKSTCPSCGYYTTKFPCWHCNYVPGTFEEQEKREDAAHARKVHELADGLVTGLRNLGLSDKEINALFDGDEKAIAKAKKLKELQLQKQ